MTDTVRLITIVGEDWDRLKAIVAKHPAALAELSDANLSIIVTEAPLSDDYVNSDDVVVASYPRTHANIPLPASLFSTASVEDQNKLGNSV